MSQQQIISLDGIFFIMTNIYRAIYPFWEWAFEKEKKGVYIQIPYQSEYYINAVKEK